MVVCATGGDGPCVQTECAPNTGKCAAAPLPTTAQCSDDDPCTVGDGCDGAGSCKPGKDACCHQDSDCAAQENGNACDGTLFCHQATGACLVNPTTIINCPTAADTACTKAACQPSTGKCQPTPLPAKAACEDGDLCTKGEACNGAGYCLGGSSTCACTTTSDCAQLDDGNACNGTHYCSPTGGGAAKPGCVLNPASVVACTSDNDADCARNECASTTGKCGLVPLPAKATCDADGTACTAGDACDGQGVCVVGTPNCGCTTDSDCASQDDGDPCTGTLYCNKAGLSGVCKLNPTTVPYCSPVDDTACIVNRCAPKTGLCTLTTLPTLAPCDDGDPCTKADYCANGTCSSGVSACGCATDADCLALDDGDLCNGVSKCKLQGDGTTGCLFAADTVVTCTDDGNACTDDGCAAKQGKCVVVPLAKGATCTDNNVCTALDGCDGAAACKGAPIVCNDGNVCTQDACQHPFGCTFTPRSGECADEDVCDGTETCSAGACVAGEPLVCSDGNLCTDDVCASGKGCVALPNAATCPDGDVCTDGQCSKGTCTSVAKPCDDGLTCTKDSCKTGIGCVSIGDDSQCADGNACTTDRCHPLKGCDHPANLLGCDDGFACTGDDVCAGGVCEAGNPALWNREATLSTASSMNAVGVVAFAGGYAMTGEYINASPQQPGVFAMHTDSDGKPDWDLAWHNDDPGAPLATRACVGGDTLYWIWSWQGDKLNIARGSLGAVNTKGVMWQYHGIALGNGIPPYFRACDASSSDVHAVGRRYESGKGIQAIYVRHAPYEKLVASTAHTAPWGSEFLDVADDGSTAIAVGYRLLSASAMRCWMVRINGSGTAVWARDVDAGIDCKTWSIAMTGGQPSRTADRAQWWTRLPAARVPMARRARSVTAAWPAHASPEPMRASACLTPIACRLTTVTCATVCCAAAGLLERRPASTMPLRSSFAPPRQLVAPAPLACPQQVYVVLSRCPPG